jgi:hypothetical protein
MMHLNGNLQDQELLNNSNFANGAALYADIKAKAALLKPRQSEAPKPAETLDGAGAPSTDPRFAGVTWS